MREKALLFSLAVIVVTVTVFGILTPGAYASDPATNNDSLNTCLANIVNAATTGQVGACFYNSQTDPVSSPGWQTLGPLDSADPLAFFNSLFNCPGDCFTSLGNGLFASNTGHEFTSSAYQSSADTAAVWVGGGMATVAIPVAAYADNLLQWILDSVSGIWEYAAAITAFLIGVGMIGRWVGRRKATQV